MAKGTIQLTPEQLARSDAHYARSPGNRKMRDAIVEYASEQGGLTLEFWRRKRGHWFGGSVIVLTETIAEELDVPMSELDRVWFETWDAVEPTLNADPDYRALTGLSRSS